jgi:UDP-glucose 4-epimerase
MSKALVTGGAGFIGSTIVKLLVEQDYEVVVLDNLFSGYRKNLQGFPSVPLIEGDIRDAVVVADTIEGADVVFHLAASVGNLRSIEQPIEDSEVNILGTIRVLEAARNAGVKKIVCSSSAAIFGELKHLPIREDHPTEPDSPYGVSKLSEEKMSLAYGRLYDLEVVCLRYFNVYGANQRYDAYGNVIPIFAHQILQGKKLRIYGDGEQTRDFVNVTDVARANLLAAQSSGISGAFNIGSGESITVNGLVKMMREASGADVDVEYVAARKGEVRDSRADISAARASLGYEPTIRMTDGLTEYMRWAAAELSQ